MKEYVTLAEKLNFTDTANSLYITQPALSKHLAYIEETFGMQLLVRTTHGVKLTTEGKIVYEDFKKVVSDYDDLYTRIQKISCGIIGNLNIGILYYAISEYIEPVVKQFQNVYSNINLSVRSAQPYQIFQYLSEDIIDIGLVMHFNFSSSAQYNFHPLRKEKLMAITLPNHHFSQKSRISPSDLAKENVILLTLDKEYSDNISQLLIKHNALPEKLITAEQVDLLPLVLEKTNGVFIGPELLRNMPRKNLIFTEIHSDDFYFDMCFAYKKNNNNASIKKFLKTWNDLNKL